MSDQAAAGAAPSGADAQDIILVAVSGAPEASALVEAGAKLAQALGRPWHAVHVETPSAGGMSEHVAVEALSTASRLGALAFRVRATSVVDGLCEHLAGAPASILVVGLRERSWPVRLWRTSLVDGLRRRRPDLALHLIASSPARRAAAPKRREGAARNYGLAVMAVAVTLGAALLLNWLFGVVSLSLLFLFPVITAAARGGAGPALLASALSALAFNFVFREPAYAIKLNAPQIWIMVTVLGLVGIYTSALTAALRGRVALSDRSAKENSDIAAFAQKLTKVADWRSTADTVCEHVGAMFGVNAVLLREVEGKLQVEARAPAGIDLSPLDWMAVDWAWSQGEPAGSGTGVLRDVNWQFQPLKTSLGVLAVLGLARDDGRNPIAGEQELLLSTLVAQAALAHERLRLEDLMREQATS